MRKQSFFSVSHPAISDAILHASKHGAQSLRAAAKKIARETQILVVKTWFDKNSRFILHVVW